MGGFLLLCGFLASGCIVSQRLFTQKSMLIRGWLGFSLGLGMLMWFPSLFAFFLDFTVTAQWLALALALGCAAAARFLPARGKPELPEPFDPEAEMPLWLPAVLVLPLLVLSGYLQYTHILRDVNGALWVGQSTYGDLCLHLGIATGLVDAGYPPTYTLLQDALLGYPFLSDAMAASLYMLGLPLSLSFTLTGTLMMGLVYLGFTCFAWELTRRRAAVILGFILMFLNGGLGFLYVLDGVFKDPSRLYQVFHGFYQTPTNMPDLNLRWVNVICDMMIPQRTLLGGWTMLLPALYLLADNLKTRSIRGWLMLGVWAGAMPMVHTHSFLALGLLSFGAGVRAIIAERNREWRRLLIGLALYGGVAVLLALPQLMTWTFPQTAGGGSLRFMFNWVNHSDQTFLIDGYFWFWIKNVGLAYLLLIPAALSGSGRERAFAWGALCIYITAELILFQPNVYDNNKLFYVAYMAMTPLVGRELAELYQRLCGFKGRAMLAALTVLVLVLSAGLTLGRETISEYELFSEQEVAAADYAREHTERSAVFLTAQQHDNPIPSLAGRQIVCGTGSYLYFHGLDYSLQQRDCRQMLSDPAASIALFEKYGVDYVYISGYERYDCAADETYFAENCPLVFSELDVQIYAWSKAARQAAN